MTPTIGAMCPVNAVTAAGIDVIFAAHDGSLAGSNRKVAHDADVGIDRDRRASRRRDPEFAVLAATRPMESAHARDDSADRKLGAIRAGDPRRA